MRTLQFLIISFALFSSALAFAQLDGDTPGSSGPSIDFSSTSTSSDSGSGSLGGGGPDLGNVVQAAADVGNLVSAIGNMISSTSSDTSSTTSSTSSGSSGGGLLGSSVTSSDWGSSLLNPIVNPIASILSGTSPANVSSNSAPTQSFGALLSSRSPYALMLDLDGNGTRGDFIDGLLYNLYFGEQLDSRGYTVANSHSSSVARIRDEERKDMAAKKIRSGLKATRIALVEALSDGRTDASSKELMAILFPKNSNQVIVAKDREVALASLVSLAVLAPALSAADGPILQSGPEELKQDTGHLRNQLWSKGLQQGDLKNIEDHDYTSRGSQLAMDVTLARLAMVMTLVESQIDKMSAPIHNETIDAMRASLYFTSFELKRMKVSGEVRDNILKGMIGALAEHTPKALKLAAAEASSPEALKRLESRFVQVAPVLNRGRGFGRFARWTAPTVAAGFTIAAWMMGGDWAVEHLSNGVGTQITIDTVATYGGPALSALLTHWALAPRGVQVISEPVRAQYTSMCELALAKKRR